VLGAGLPSSQSRHGRDRATLCPSPLVQQLLLLAPILLFSIIAHEIAHGYAALSQGDPTALKMGRLTWNPIKHIDPFMSVILPAMLYLAHGPVLAGAKPVPVDPRNYRNFKRGDIIVSLAGIAANVAIAVGCTILSFVFGAVGKAIPSVASVLGILQAMALIGVELNLILAAFNLLPIPPLDGSHVLKYLLPPAWAMRYQQIGFVGIIALLVLLYYTPVVGYWLAPAFYGASFVKAAVDARDVLLPTTQTLLRGFFA
jgi:Zn-dependent protease